MHLKNIKLILRNIIIIMVTAVLKLSFETDFILYSLNKFNILIVLDFID